jgi:hypothetical protein
MIFAAKIIATTRSRCYGVELNDEKYQSDAHTVIDANYHEQPSREKHYFRRKKNQMHRSENRNFWRALSTSDFLAFGALLSSFTIYTLVWHLRLLALGERYGQKQNQ